MSDSGADAGFFKALLHEVQDAIWVSDADDRLIYTNRSMERILPDFSGELDGKRIVDILPPHVAKQFAPHVDRVRQSVEPICFEVQADAFASPHRPGSVTLTPRVEGGRFAGMVCTITKCAGHDPRDNGLTDSETQLRSILDSTQQSFVLIAPDYSIRAFNEVAAQATSLAFGRNIMAGQSILEYVLPGDEANFRKDFDKALRGESVTVEKKMPGEEWYSFTFNPVQADDSRIIGVCFVSTDITDRKQTEEALRQSEENFRSLADTARVMIAIVADAGGKQFLYVNDEWQRVYGYSKEEAQSIRPIDTIAPEYRQQVLANAAKRIEGKPAPYSYELQIVTKNGERKYLDFASTIINFENQKAFLTTALDITERKRAEEVLQESESRVRTKLKALLDPDGDLGALNLADIVACDQIQSLMNDFHALTGIGVGIVDLDGNVLVSTGWQDMCTKFHRVHPETAQNCRQSDTALASGVEPGTFKIYKCKNNMWDMATPIMLGERHVGNLFLGQFFFEDEKPSLDLFREQAHRYGFDEDAYLAAYHGVPRWSRQMVDRAMTFYCNLIGLIARLSFAHIKLASATESLRKTQSELSAIYNSNPIMMCVMDSDRRILYANPAFTAFMGSDKPTLTEGAACGALGCVNALDDPRGCGYGPECRACPMLGGITETFQSGVGKKDIEQHMVVRDERGQREVWLLASTALIQRPDGPAVLLCMQDITERKRAEEALAEQQALLTAIYRNAPLVLMVVDDERRVRQVNGFTSQFVERSMEDMLGLRGGEALRCLHALDDPEGCGFGEYCRQCVIRNVVIDTLETGETHLQLEAPFFFLKNGETREMTFLLSTTPLSVKGARMALVTLQDITDRKEAEKEIAKRELTLDRIFDVLPIGLWFADKDGRLLRGNPAGVRIWGAEPTVPIEEYGMFRGRRLPSGEEIAPDDWALAHTVREGTTITDELLEIDAFDGQKRVILNYTAPVINDSGEMLGAIVVNNDITLYNEAEADRERLQAQLNQAQKMESVGRLAGGVAHDFNNMLNVILGNVEMVLEELAADSPLAADLHEVQKAAERSSSLTRQLLAFARKQTIAPKVIDLNHTIAMMLKMLERLVGEDVKLVWIPGDNLEPVLMDPGQLDQMLANLVVNARDAIAGTGAITIESRRAEFSQEYCDGHPGAVPGDYVELAVSDDGRGMDEETQERIFEPFFTTKDVGQGTGLGLATVYGITKQNGGFINVYSEVGHGTTFRIYLPVHHDARALQDAGDKLCAPVSHGDETILLVEDEPAILSTSTRMLSRMGYHVLGATSPSQALKLAEEHSDQIDLLVTDIVMPEMNGRDLARQLKDMYPGLSCLFMSGYTADVIAQQGVLDQGVNFIAKPFGRQALGQKVREVLDRKA